jgi:CelD/BcsL family acetyltransferase involved in cellulose biosynthesis
VPESLDAERPLEIPEEQIDTSVVNPLTDARWDRGIGSHSQATVFHTSAWARVLNDTYGHQPFYLNLSTQGRPLALVPMMEVRSWLTRLRGICLPFSDSCGPLLFNGCGAETIAKKLRQLGRERGWDYFEVRDSAILPQGVQGFESYWSHTLDLTIGITALSSKFSSSARRALRKAERSGLATRVRTDAEAMAQFYALHARTRRKHGAPPQPRRFFANMQKHIIEAGLGCIVTAEKAKRVLAAAIFFRLNHHALYKFGASDERWQEWRPNNLVMAKAISFLADSSMRTLHFGRTDKTNEGLRRFKLSWGAAEEEISYGKFAISTDNWVRVRNHISSLPNRIFRALPGPLNRLAGVLLYPHLD